jgi:molybdopterin converting factor subunit 1
MTIPVHLFARARDLAGTALVSVDLPTGATVADLRRALATAHPALSALLPRCAIAVNNDFADDCSILSSTCEVALLPPVSGG